MHIFVIFFIQISIDTVLANFYIPMSYWLKLFPQTSILNIFCSFLEVNLVNFTKDDWYGLELI